MQANTVKQIFFYGWILVFVCVVVQAFSFGLSSYSFSVFAAYYEEEFAVGRGLLMLCMTGFLLAIGVMSPRVGSIIDRFSIKTIMIAGSAVMSLGYIMLSFANSMWLVILLYTLLLSVGGSTLGPLCTSTILSRWFIRNRGLALGIAALGTQLGGLVFPPMMAWFIAALGWRESWRYIGVVALLFLPLVIKLTVRDHPAQRGLSPDGLELVGATVSSPRNDASSLHVLLAKDIFKGRTFWVIALVVSLCNAVSTIALTNLALLGKEVGLDMPSASLLISLTAAMGFISSPILGRLCDAWDVRWVVFSVLAMNIVGLLSYAALQSELSLMILAIFIGLAAGGNVPLWGVLVGKLFPNDHYVRIPAMTDT
jgi:sugar phosphate permease